MKPRMIALALVFVAFVGFSTLVVVNHGITGLFDVLAHQWGQQIFTDLVIALVLFSMWMFRDAKKRGIPALPYFVLILASGSIGALAYLMHRTAKS